MGIAIGIVIIVILVLGVSFLFFTKEGKIIRLRMSGTVGEMITKDASTIDGTTAHYNNAIAKKEEEYKEAYDSHALILGEISSYEKELRDLQKESMQTSIKINDCIDNNDDESAKIYLSSKQGIDEKIDIIKDTLKTLRENSEIQKENAEILYKQIDELKAEKEKSLLILKTSQSTKNTKATCKNQLNEEDKILEKVREGVRKCQNEANGYKMAYENSPNTQQAKLDEKMKNKDIEDKLQELKKLRGNK